MTRARTIEMSADELFFDVLTPLGFRVRVTRRYWDFIVSIKHPVMTGRKAQVEEALRNSDEIRSSKGDSQVFLFYKSEGARRWVCAVAKRLNEDGFLITAYPTDAIKEGQTIWHR